MRSSNPIFANLEKNSADQVVSTNTATHKGIVIKTLILIALTLASGFASIYLPEGILIGILIASIFGSFILVFISMISINFAPIGSIIYAITQGVLYGVLTYFVDYFVPGAGIIAISATGAIFGVMLLLYATGLLRASAFLYKFVIGSLISILLASLIFVIVSLINPAFSDSITNNFPLMVGLSLFFILIGAFMLILDFDRADKTVAMGLPKKAEWQVALGLMITLIWIYVEILRLILIIASKKN